MLRWEASIPSIKPFKVDCAIEFQDALCLAFRFSIPRWKKNLSHRMGNRLTFSFPRIPPCESESSSSSIGWFIGFIRHQLRHNDHHTLVSNDAIFLAVIALESGETLEQEATKNYGIKWATIFSLIFSFFYFIFLFISSSSERKIFSCLSYKIIIFFLFII